MKHRVEIQEDNTAVNTVFEMAGSKDSILSRIREWFAQGFAEVTINRNGKHEPVTYIIPTHRIRLISISEPLATDGKGVRS